MSTGIAALLAMGSNEDANPGLLLATVTATSPALKVQIDGATTTTTATKTVPVFTGDRVIVEFIGKSAYIMRNLNFDSGWVIPTLGSGWTAYGAGWAPLGYRRLNGVVHLKGLAHPVVGQTPFFLPTGYLPLENQLFIVENDNVACRIQVRTDGAVFQDSGGTSGGYISWSGVSFPAEA